MPNVKFDDNKHNSNWKRQTGGKQQRIQSIKYKNIKKASLSTSPTNIHAIKLFLQSKQKREIDLSKMTSENTKDVLTIVMNMSFSNVSFGRGKQSVLKRSIMSW